MGFLDLIFGTQAAEPEKRSFSVSDAAFAEWLAMNGWALTELSHDRAMGITAYYRGVTLIASTIAGLPLKTYKEDGSGRKRVKSFLDRPAGPTAKMTPFTWKELVALHLVTRNEAFLLHIYNQAGALVGLWPVHPTAVTEVRWTQDGGKTFKVRWDDGTTREFDSSEMTHIPGPYTDGTRGIPLITAFSATMKTAIAADNAAFRSASQGLAVAGLVTPEVDLEEAEAKAIKEGLAAKMTGPDNAGGIAVVNRALKFQALSMTAVEAQFLESREFNVSEFARMLGIPPHLLAAIEKQTSWGTGVAEQNLGLQRYTLMGWTSRTEEALSDLLPASRWCEFEYAGLLQGTPADEIELLIKQVEAGLMTRDEARAIRNLPPLTPEQKAELKPSAPTTEEPNTNG